MMQLNLAKVLLLGDETKGYIRYEIFSKRENALIILKNSGLS